MPSKKLWPWWEQPTGTTDYRVRELLRAILDLHGYYGDKDVWLWRGQANADHDLTAGVHTRIEFSNRAVDDGSVVSATESLLDDLRRAKLDTHEGAALPDLALLAQAQHHGAATPLLDVSMDPMVALYMAVVSPSSRDAEKDGVLFAIRRPTMTDDVKVLPFDTRSFRKIYGDLPRSKPILYSAPDVSDRLRIQRGHFLLSTVSTTDARVRVNLTAESQGASETWLANRLARRGRPGRVGAPKSDIATFRIDKKFKRMLQDWIEERTGLTEEYVYPTIWHQPHQEVFAKSHGRRSKV
ncbi:hypothetical protein GCM10009625_20850 [Brachybacterium fresconis]